MAALRYMLTGLRLTTASPITCMRLMVSYLITNRHAAAKLSSPEKSPGQRPVFLGLQDKLYLGNLDAQRDWGYAKEYVETMWLMLQQDQGDDYVMATNETHSVREFVQKTFELLDLDWEQYVDYDQRYERPTEVDLLIGDPAKAKRKLNWEPKVRFKNLVKIMVDADLVLAKQELAYQQATR